MSLLNPVLAACKTLGRPSSWRHSWEQASKAASSIERGFYRVCPYLCTPCIRASLPRHSFAYLVLLVPLWPLWSSLHQAEMQLKALSHFASVAAAAIVGVVLERIRARRNYALIERAPGFKAWRMSKWVKHAGRIETQGLVGTDAASSIADQTAQALAKLDAILTEAGSSRDKLLSVTIYLRDIESATPRLPFNVSRHRVDEVSGATAHS